MALDFIAGSFSGYAPPYPDLDFIPFSDSIPDAFDLGDASAVLPGSTHLSSIITVAGINVSAAISVAGGMYAINGGAFTSAVGSVVAGDTVQVSGVASSSWSSTVNVVLSIGGISDTFSVTTVAEDQVPDAFSFASVADALPLAEVTSESITVAGINAASPITIDAGLYSINGFFTGAPAEVVAGDVVSVRLTAPDDYGLTLTATLTIGGVSAGFSVSTLVAPPPMPAPTYVSAWRAPWGRAASRSRARRASWGALAACGLRARLRQDAGAPRDGGSIVAWGVLDTRAALARLPQGRFSGVERPVVLPWADLPARDTGSLLRWAFNLARRNRGLSVLWSDPPRHDRQIVAPCWNDPQPYPLSGGWYQRPLMEIASGADLLIDFGALRLDFIAAPGSTATTWPALDFIAGPSPPPAYRGPPIDLLWPPLRAPIDRLIPSQGETLLPWGAAPAVDRSLRTRWGKGSPAQGGPDIPWEAEPDPDEPDPSTIVVPPLKVYVVTNSIAVVRLPDLTPIEALAVSASIDYEAWSWRISLTLGREADLALLDPSGGPKEVQITINGFVLVGVVERYSRDLRFGQKTWTAEARSRTAYLAEPFARPRSYRSTGLASAQQLALDELPSGWSLSWEVPDWTVPAGAWSYDQRTPIEAIGRLAEAIGAVLQPHPAEQTLRVISRYPTSPDEWPSATPAASYTESILTRMGSSYMPGTDRNQIVIEGGTQGVRVVATRQGTAGDDPLPSITEQLCTALECGQERARVELDAEGDRLEQSYALPIMGALGVRLPGDLDQITEGGSTWRGLVRSVSISAARSADGVRVAQEVSVERVA